MSAGSGFKDKLYWRDPENTGKYHCFKKVSWIGRQYRYEPLCGESYTLRHTGRQAIERPEPAERCGRCDGLEMERRGWAESGPATI